MHQPLSLSWSRELPVVPTTSIVFSRNKSILPRLPASALALAYRDYRPRQG
jgi:hypothetical protein